MVQVRQLAEAQDGDAHRVCCSGEGEKDGRGGRESRNRVFHGQFRQRHAPSGGIRRKGQSALHCNKVQPAFRLSDGRRHPRGCGHHLLHERLQRPAPRQILHQVRVRGHRLGRNPRERGEAVPQQRGTQVFRSECLHHRPYRVDECGRGRFPQGRGKGGVRIRHGSGHCGGVLQRGNPFLLRAERRGRLRGLRRERHRQAVLLHRPGGAEQLRHAAFRPYGQVGRVGDDGAEAGAHHHPEVDCELQQRHRGLVRPSPHRLSQVLPGKRCRQQEFRNRG